VRFVPGRQAQPEPPRIDAAQVQMAHVAQRRERERHITRGQAIAGERGAITHGRQPVRGRIEAVRRRGVEARDHRRGRRAGEALRCRPDRGRRARPVHADDIGGFRLRGAERARDAGHAGTVRSGRLRPGRLDEARPNGEHRHDDTDANEPRACGHTLQHRTSRANAACVRAHGEYAASPGCPRRDSPGHGELPRR